MTALEKQYRGVVNRISFALLLFLGLLLLQGVVLGVLSTLLRGLSAVAYDVVYELTSGVLYAAAFSLPVLFFYRLPSDTPAEPMFLKLSLPRETVLYIFFGVALVSACAHVNSVMVSVFDYSAFSEEILWDSDVSSNYELVLMFFTLAVVPAFVEELLFRGLILGNLLPYGRTTAILASALLFGVMHQNAEQLFYATAAGVVLGWVYVRTRSIWPCVLLHFVNNFQSVLQTAVLQRLPESTANAVLYAVQVSIFLLGILSGMLLFLRERDTRAALRQTGVFEREVPADADYAPREIPVARRVRLFFSVPMIIFFVWCVIQMLSLILMAVTMY